MMKIHTTQDLKLFNRNISANNKQDNKPISSPFSLERQGSFGYSENSLANSISFQKKLPKNSENSKKIIDAAKKGLEDIKDKAMPEVQKGDDFLMSSFFNACLKLVTKSELVFNAVSAAVICIVLRPLTIMALPSKSSAPKAKTESKTEKNSTNIEIKNDKVADSTTEEKSKEVSFKGKQKERSAEKTNNIYASAQSISSGLAGIVTTIVLTVPFKNGQDHVMKNLHEFLSADKIKKLYPWVDKASMIGKDGKLLNSKQWKNIDGLEFISDIKNCAMLPEFRKLSDVSKETFNKILKLDIDFAAQKGKSFNDVVAKDGKKIYDTIDFNRLGIVVKEDGYKDVQILLRDLDKGYLEKLIADSKGVNEWGNLNIASVFENGEVKDFRKWKDVNGKNWKLDLDSINVYSELETANYRPRFSGEKRFDKKDQEWKFVAHQDNGIDGKLGSKITNEMVEAEANNAGLIKCLTWLPDIAFRVPVAVGTIALIPWVLKNIFHLEKVKPSDETKADTVKNAELTKEQEKEVSFKGKRLEPNNDNNNISFKGGKPNPKKPSWLTKLLAKLYGKPLLESPKMQKFSQWLTTVPGDVSEHMVVLGSLIQSSVYVNRTLSNKDLDDDRKKTLAINQTLCFIIPTIAGYTVNSALRDVIKNVGYRYTGKMKHKIAELKAAGNEAAAKKAEQIASTLGKNIKGVGTLASLATFTLIYRYLSPVLVTPIANRLGDKYLNNKKEKESKVA